jgi:RNA polymerase sigma factor (sigma-70 family)
MGREQLVEATEADLSVIAERLYTRLVAASWGVVRRRDLAEEIVQDSLVTAHQQWPAVGRMEHPEAWLYRCVMNRSVSALRRMAIEAKVVARMGRQRRPAPPDSDDGVAVRRAVRSLPSKQATAVSLHYFADLPVEQVAEVMGIPDGSVKSLLHRARATLRSKLDSGA